MSATQEKTKISKPYTFGQAFFFGVIAVMAAALINLLPWILALRETPAGVERKRQAGIKEKLAERKRLDRELVLAGARLKLEKDATKARAIKGKIWDLNQERSDKVRVINKWRREIRDMPEMRKAIGERYEFESWLHLPAVTLIEATIEKGRVKPEKGKGKAPGFFLRYLDSPVDRLRASFMLLCFWVPWAVLMGVLLGVLSWRKNACTDMADCRAERKISIKLFFFLDAAWWLLFLVLVPFAGKIPTVVEGFFKTLFLVKFIEIYLTLRGSMALMICQRRTLTYGILSGVFVVYLIPLLMLYEEFNHTLEVRVALGQKRKRRSPEDLVGKARDPEDDEGSPTPKSG